MATVSRIGAGDVNTGLLHEFYHALSNGSAFLFPRERVDQKVDFLWKVPNLYLFMEHIGEHRAMSPLLLPG